MSADVEKKNRRIGIGVSIGFHGLILFLFFLIMAWREPDPPVPEYGIELNFGLDDVGAGNIQPEEPAAASPAAEEQITEEEELIDEPAENIPAEETPVQQDQTVQEEAILQDSEMEDSPDIIEPANTQTEPVDEPEKVEEIAEEQNVEPEVEDKIVEEQVVARNDNVTETIENGQGTAEDQAGEAETASHGDNADVTGDEGDPQGTLDSRALYGTYGGGGGPLLELTGWIWDFEPDPDDTSNENGRIVFEIKIDDMGEIISVRTLETTVSPAVERIYKTEVESLTFSPVSTNTMPAAVSTGKITFIIRSK